MFRCVSASVCEYSHVHASPYSAQKKASDLLELELSWLQPPDLVTEN